MSSNSVPQSNSRFEIDDHKLLKMVDLMVHHRNREDLVAFRSSFVSQMLEPGIQSLCCIPLVTRKGALGTLNLASKEHSAFIGQDLDFLKQVVGQVAVALDNAHAYREIAELKDKLAKEKL
jgi:formate hydrogenlyase transcriptional activator